MGKPLTTKQLTEVVTAMQEGHLVALEDLHRRLNAAAQYCKAQDARIAALEAQGEKTKRQLSWLQKVAKGIFTVKPKVEAAPPTPAEMDAEDALAQRQEWNEEAHALRSESAVAEFVETADRNDCPF